METVYKVFINDNNSIKNLFRGIEGSRTIPVDKWLRAENRMSVDGSGQEPYLTGIHVLKDKEKAIKYLDNFRKPKERIIIKCLAKDLRQKPTNENVYLADWIYIPKEFKIVS